MARNSSQVPSEAGPSFSFLNGNSQSEGERREIRQSYRKLLDDLNGELTLHWVWRMNKFHVYYIIYDTRCVREMPGLMSQKIFISDPNIKIIILEYVTQLAQLSAAIELFFPSYIKQWAQKNEHVWNFWSDKGKGYQKLLDSYSKWDRWCHFHKILDGAKGFKRCQYIADSPRSRRPSVD